MTSVASHLNKPVPLLVMDPSWSKEGSNTTLTQSTDEKIKKDFSSVRVDSALVVDPTLTALLNESSQPISFYQKSNAMILYTSGTTGK
jgi:acyl-coenzyme A synthetase/AMP-(fatty) acid ligase